MTHAISTLPYPRGFAFVLLFLGLTGNPAAAAQELELLWQSTIAPAVEIPGQSLEVRGRGTVVATASLLKDGGRLDLRVFDSAGTQLWLRSVDLVGQETFADLELSPDGGTLFVLFQRPNPSKFLKVASFDALTGVEGWSRTLVGDVSLDFVSGQVAVEGGRVAVLSSDFSSGQVYQSRLTTLLATNGSVLSTSANFSFKSPALYLATSGLTSILFSPTGEMAAVNSGTGQTDWSVAVPTTPTPVVLGSGVTAVALNGSESVLARTDGAATVAFDAANGAQLWSQPAIGARDIAAYSQDRFFVCGQRALGSIQTGTIQGYGMLAADSGAVLWSGTQQSLSLGSAALFIQTTRVAVAPAQERVAYREKGLFIFDAATGAPAGNAVFSSADAIQNPLSVLSDGTWVSGNSPLDFSDGNLVEAFQSNGQFKWSAKAVDEAVPPTRPRWIESRAGGERLHLLWEFNPLLPQWPSNGQWEVRASADGSIQSSWPWPATLWSPTASFALDPSGQRLATLRGSVGAPAKVFVETFDALQGTSLNLVELNAGISGSERDIAWSANGQRFAAGWLDGSQFRVTGFLASGQQIWQVSVPVPGALNLGTPAVAFDAATGDLLAAMEYRTLGGDQALSVTRLAANSGANLGQLVWDGDGPVSALVDHSVLALHPDATTARTYAVVQVATPSSTDALWVIAMDAATMTVTAQRLVAPEGLTVSYGKSGSAVTPDSSALLLAGTGPQGPGSFLAKLQIDGLDLPGLTPRFQSTRSTGSNFNQAQLEVLNSEVGVLRYSWGNIFPQSTSRLELIDLTNGKTLEALDATQGLLLESLIAAAGKRVAVFGRSSGDPLNSRLQTYAVAALLSGPSALTTAGGAVDFVLDAGPERAGEPYVLLGSTSGTTPSTPVNGLNLPLVLDAYTTVLLLGSNTGPFVGTHGQLNAAGTARARIDVPALPVLAGLEFTHLGILIGTGGAVDFVSQPVNFSVQN